MRGVRSHGVRMGNWLSLRQAQALLNTPDIRTKKGLRDRMFATARQRILAQAQANEGGNSQKMLMAAVQDPPQLPQKGGESKCKNVYNEVGECAASDRTRPHRLNGGYYQAKRPGGSDAEASAARMRSERPWSIWFKPVPHPCTRAW
jgi:hypothetical protein